MEEFLATFLGAILTLGIPAFLIMLGFIVGRAVEKNHLNDLAQREVRSRDMLITQTKSYLGLDDVDRTPTMVVSEVVISSDYLKTMIGALINLFGGEVRPFQVLLDRARREALMRVKEQAMERGYNALCNVRMEAADIGGRQASRSKIVMASMLVSATAYHARIDPPSGDGDDQPIAATLV